MAKKTVKVKAKAKVTPIKPSLRSKAPGMLTDKIVAVVKSKSKK